MADLYSPATVAELRRRWATGTHLADNKPAQLVEFRTGRFKHGYAPWEGEPIDAFVAGGYIRQPGEPTPSGWPISGYGRLYWQNTWTPDDGDDGLFAPLPGVLDVDRNKNFQNNGIEIATIAVENIAYPQAIGPGGAYREVKRGWLAPNRGYESPSRPPLMEPGLDGTFVPVDKTEWYRKLNSGSCQIRIWEGYGDLLVPVWTGLVDDTDPEAAPDRMTITARDFGQALTDERIFGWNKEPRILDPVVFMDRLRADDVKKVGYGAAASSVADGHEASCVADDDSDTFWYSDGHAGPDFTEWVQIKVPEGRYEDYYLFPRYTGMEIFVSIRAAAGSSRDGEELPEGWVDLGHGDVPGANGGVPYVAHREGIPASGKYRTLSGSYQLGEGSIIRISLRRLHRRPDARYHAAVNRLFANKRRVSSQAREKHWVLVDDVADMVRVVLRWAGFKEWEVETTGVRLKERQVIPRSAFYMDVIKKAQELTGYVFFMKPPTDNDLSIGIPCFRRPVVVDPRFEPVATVHDRDLLTSIKGKESDEPRPFIIRVRGRTATQAEGGEALAGDRTRRVMFTFKPPGWSRLGGIVKHVVWTNNSFRTADDVKFGAYYMALQSLLEAYKASCGLPCFPFLDLDSHLAVMDVATGLTTRLWLSERQAHFHAGEQKAYTMAVGGALVDTPEIQKMCRLIDATPRGSEH